jgi:N-acetylneuraminic acid mutarotase
VGGNSRCSPGSLKAFPAVFSLLGFHTCWFFQEGTVAMEAAARNCVRQFRIRRGIGANTPIFILSLLFLPLLLLCPRALAQAGQWAWISGSDTAYANGVYGTMGVPAPSNIPGARENATTWIDATGNLWFFGGTQYQCNGCYWGPGNDLWKYNPSTGYWTWVSGSDQSGGFGVYGTQGVPAAGNIPGSRDSAASWIDSNGDLWLFGGEGFDAVGEYGDLNDLWNYNPSTGNWTWVTGSSTIPIQNSVCAPGVYGRLRSPNRYNVPGGRLGASSLTDIEGNLWLFGGQGCDSTGNEDELDDLWEFTPSTTQWTWVSGSNFAAQPGTYGTLGQPGLKNVPGGRQGVAAWIDSSGGLWFFGGYGYDSTGDEDELNDLWNFNVSTFEWTWMSGSKVAAQPGVYGTIGVPSKTNIPGGRQNAAAWIDSANNVWLFGGNGYDSQDNEGGLNDLWKFAPAAGEWTWVGGDTVLIEGSESWPGVYGTRGVFNNNNIPGGRAGSSNWTDTNGNFWLFGGQGADHSPDDGSNLPLNDLWKYKSAVPTAAMPVFNPAGGVYTGVKSVTISDATAGATIYYTTDGTAPTNSSAIYSGPISVTASEIVRAIAAASGYNQSYVSSAIYTINLLPTAATPVFDPPAGTYGTAQSVTITDTTPGAAIFYTTDGSTPTTSSTPYRNPIAVGVAVTIQAIAVASKYLSSNVASATYSITQPIPVLHSISPLYAGTGTTFTLTVTGTNFTPTSIINWGGVAATTKYVSSTELTAQVTALINEAAVSSGWETVNVSVSTLDGVSSGVLAFDVVSPYGSAYPVTITPASASVNAGSSATFTLTFASGALGALSQCINLPVGANCVYNSNANTQSSGTLTITTSSTTPAGTYVITVGCSETVPITAAAKAAVSPGLMTPAILIPFGFLRRRLKKKSKSKCAQLTICVGLLFVCAALLVSCGGVSTNENGTLSSTTSATTAAAVTLTVR